MEQLPLGLPTYKGKVCWEKIIFLLLLFEDEIENFALSNMIRIYFIFSLVVNFFCQCISLDP